MSITEGHSEPPAAKPHWRSLYSGILFVLGVGTIYLTYRTAGSEALFAALLSGSLVGAGFVVVTHRWLQWCSLLVFGGVMIGSIAAVELAVRDGSVPVNWLHDSGVPTLNSDSDMPAMILERHAAFGALVGGVMGTIAGGWLVARFGLRVQGPILRWYQPTRLALVGLLLFSGCTASCIVLTTYNDYRYSKRAEAARAIMDRGGKIDWESLRKDMANGDASEIDVRNSDVSDAELHCMIALMSPQGRLRLGGSRISDDGVKELQKALPYCKIER